MNAHSSKVPLRSYLIIYLYIEDKAAVILKALWGPMELSNLSMLMERSKLSDYLSSISGCPSTFISILFGPSFVLFPLPHHWVGPHRSAWIKRVLNWWCYLCTSWISFGHKEWKTCWMRCISQAGLALLFVFWFCAQELRIFCLLDIKCLLNFDSSLLPSCGDPCSCFSGIFQCPFPPNRLSSYIVQNGTN